MNLDQLRSWIRDQVGSNGATEWIIALGGAALAVLVALVVHRVVFHVLLRFANASDLEADNIVLRRIARPTRYALVALALVLVARELPALR